MLADGVTSHGPIVEIDKDGHEVLVGRTVRGKREGRFVEPDRAGLTVEAFYLDGLVHGTLALRRANGRVFAEQAFVHGQRHGARREWNADGTLRSIEHYDHGVPTGEWTQSGTKRTYGPNGMLISLDGKPVAPAPEALTLPDGSSLQRAECVRRAGFAWDGLHPPAEPICLDIFEEVQLCGDDACKRAAVAKLEHRR